MRFAELVDVAVMERLCQRFAAVTGMELSLMDPEGNWLTRSQGRPICSMFHRVRPATGRRCWESDTDLARRLGAGESYGVHRCENGLVDVAVPVVVGGERLADFYAGQFFLEPPDRATFEEQARTFGFDAAAYVAALEEVPIIPAERARRLIEFFSELASVIGELGLARRRLEEANRATAASEALLRTVTDSSPELVFLKDRAGRWRFANPATLAFLGRTRDQVLGKTDAEVYEDREAVAAIQRVDREVVEQGVRRVHEQRIRSPRGDRVLLASKAPYRDVAGDVVGLVGNARDITERHGMEEGLRRANRALRLLRACSQSIVRAASEDALFTDVCRAVVEVGGYRMCWVGLAEQDERRTVRPVAHAGHEDGYLSTAQITWGDGPAGQGPVGSAARSGRPVIGRDLAVEPGFEPWRAEALKRGYRSITALPLLHGGRLLGVIAMYASEVKASDAEEVELLSQLASDVAFGVASLRERAARARAEAALRESEERLRVVVEAAHEGIVKRRRDGRITVFNPAAERITGLTASQMQGRTPYPPGWYTVREDGSFLPTEERPNRVTLRTGQRSTNVIVGHHLPDGSTTWCAVNSEPVFRDGEREPWAVVATYTDLTAQREQAAIQRQLEEQLQLARKLESIGRLAGGIAHDFNNLLTVILGGAQELRDAVDAGRSVASEVIEDIQAASRRAAELTGQLLAFARKQVTAPVALDLNAVVQRSEKLLRRVLGEDVELVTKAGAEPAAIRCDPGQLDQVILNLAINARDAMPGGGKLTLETSNVLVDGELVAQHPFMRPGAYVRLIVADTGLGMTPEVKARVFEPFFTTKPQGKGTGLGLATVYGIMKQSDGYVLLDSAAGRGTTFALYFPRTEEIPGVAPAPRAASGGCETVLVVEDDPQVRAVTVRAIRSGGYRVLVAGAGEEALEVVAHEAAPIHLVVTDVVMPGLNGRQLVSELQRRHPGLRALFVSGYPGDVLSQASHLDGDVELLAKPFTTGTLLARVRALLDSR